MKSWPIILILASGCAAQRRPIPTKLWSVTSFAQPEALTTGFLPPTLILTSPPPSDMQIIWPNEFTRTNYSWWCEVADEPGGPWRYPSNPQFPDNSNWVVKLDGAHYLRLCGNPY